MPSRTAVKKIRNFQTFQIKISRLKNCCFYVNIFRPLGHGPTARGRNHTSFVILRLSQSLWTMKPKNFYHPNQLSTRCVVESFQFLILLSVSSFRGSGLTSLTTPRKIRLTLSIFFGDNIKGKEKSKPF